MILLKKKNYLGTNETAIGETIEIKNEKTEIKKFIIDGKSTQDGEPTPDAPVEIESVGYTNLFDGEVESGNINSSGVNYNDTTSIRSKNHIKVQPNTTYILSNNGVLFGLNISEYNANKEFVSRTYVNATRITTSSTTEYIRFQVATIEEPKFQLEEGLIIHPYIPYGKSGIEVKTTNGTDTNSTVIVLDKPLRSLPNGIKDIAYIKNNKLYVDRYVGSVVLDGSETFNTLSNPNRFAITKAYNVVDDTQQYSSHYVWGAWGNADYSIDVRTNGIRINNKDNLTIDEYKAWLSQNNVQVDYELTTPVTEELGDLTILELVDGENNISNSENANMKIEYVNYTPEIFEFNTILQSGYRINEQQNLISKKQFVNGKRKKINTSYTDVIINLDLGCFDGNTLGECLTNLTDGEYEYYSLKDKKIKNANFIVTLPELQVDNSACEVFVGDFTATLEKSSDVE